MADTPSRKEIYSLMAAVAVTTVSAAFSLDVYRDETRKHDVDRTMQQISDRISSANNRIDLIDGDLTAITAAVIQAGAAELKLPVDEDDDAAARVE